MTDPLNIAPIGKEIVEAAIDKLDQRMPTLASGGLDALCGYRFRVMLIQGGLEITVDRRTVDGIGVQK